MSIHSIPGSAYDWRVFSRLGREFAFAVDHDGEREGTGRVYHEKSVSCGWC